MEVYRKLLIYYFSGTGNSRNVALWLSRVAEEKGIESRLVNIALVDRKNIAIPDPDALIAFISPIHGFNYPPIMLHFIIRFPKGNNKVLLMNTRAGMLIGKFITPGLTGIAFNLSAIILWLKGFSIKAMFPVDLPSNWVSFHPGLNERTVKYLHVKNKERVTAFAERIFSGKSDYRGLYAIIPDTLVAPISIAYYLFGRFLLAKTFYASSDCDKCNICINSCPVHAIINVDKRPFWTFRCESCMRCMGNCPRKAIEAGHGFVAVFVWVFSSVFVVLLLELFNKYIGSETGNGTIFSIVKTLLLFILIALCYRITHYLMRFRFFERIMVYTSLTKYRFWGRKYRALKE
jgi:Pyruvate/2-oxoacid:ferredoxin oxidoreductase delta subunit